MADDLSESTDLAGKHPEKVKALTTLHDGWLAQMAEPLKGGGKLWTPDSEKTKRKKLRKK